MNSNSLKKVIINAEYSRKFPDPLNKSSNGDKLNIEHHIILTRAINLSPEISDAPNPREQNTDLGIYKEVRLSLDTGIDPTFHLKNKGITIFADKVDDSNRPDIVVYLDERNKDGIADGGHTDSIIQESIADGTIPETQYVKIEVLTGVPKNMRTEIAGGLNTAVQVQKASLLNLEGRFQWIKDLLKDTSYGDSIAYKQNEKRPYDIREIIGLMTLFNVNEFPYPQHPKEGYTSKAKCLALYEKAPDSFMMLKPLIKDILYLSHYVHIQGRLRYNQASGGKAGAMIGVYAPKKGSGEYEFIFLNGERFEDEEENEKRIYKLYDGALYPLLGAMRFLIEQKKGETVYSWKLNSFNEVKTFFDEIAPELVAITYKTSQTYGLKPNPIGKDDNHWDNLYKTAAIHYMTKYPN